MLSEVWKQNEINILEIGVVLENVEGCLDTSAKGGDVNYFDIRSLE